MSRIRESLSYGSKRAWGTTGAMHREAPGYSTMVPFGQNLAPQRSEIEMLEVWIFFKTVLIIPYKRDKFPLLRFSIPVFHHSIIPVWKKKNGRAAIPYYQTFLEITIH
jgi:hypothetical protein